MQHLYHGQESVAGQVLQRDGSSMQVDTLPQEDFYRSPSSKLRIFLGNIRGIDALIIFAVIAARYFIQDIGGTLITACCMCFVLLAIMAKIICYVLPVYGFRFIGRAILIFLLGIAYFMPLHQIDLIMAMLLAIALCDMTVEDSFEYAGYVSSVLFAIQLSLYKFGLIVDKMQWDRYDEDIAVSARRAIGFGHPNFVGLFVFPVLVAFLVSKRKTSRIYFGVIGLAYAYITYKYTDSRTFFYTAIVILFFGLIRDVFANSLFCAKCLILAVPVTVGATFALAIWGNSNYSLSLLLSGRPYLWNRIISREMPRLYGPTGSIKAYYQQGKSIDNIWMHLFYVYGILITLVIIVLLCYFLNKCVSDGHVYLALVAVAYLIYGLMEHHLFDYGYSVFPIILFAPFFNSSWLRED